jgi:hypothetical protein
MLMRLGIAEIGQRATAHVFGDEAAGLGDEIGAAELAVAHRFNPPGVDAGHLLPDLGAELHSFSFQQIR